MSGAMVFGMLCHEERKDQKEERNSCARAGKNKQSIQRKNDPSTLDNVPHKASKPLVPFGPQGNTHTHTHTFAGYAQRPLQISQTLSNTAMEKAKTKPFFNCKYHEL